MKSLMINKEVWKDIPNYEGHYQASNLGRIRSIKKEIKILKEINRNDGYLFVNLSKNGKSKPIKIHKIIAYTFLKNNNNYTDINHKDGNKQNNCVNNLEFCNRSHNIKEAYRLKLRKPNKTNIGKRKKVLQKDKDGKPIKIWDSIKEASIKLNIKDSNISQVCKSKRNYAGNYIWEYAYDTLETKTNALKKKMESIKYEEFNN